MLTQKLELPKQKELERKSWNVKQLFPFREAISILKKKSNIYEMFATFMILVTAIAELSGRYLSYFWYVLVVLVLAEALYLRTFFVQKDEEKEK